MKRSGENQESPVCYKYLRVRDPTAAEQTLQTSGQIQSTLGISIMGIAQLLHLAFPEVAVRSFHGKFPKATKQGMNI